MAEIWLNPRRSRRFLIMQKVIVSLTFVFVTHLADAADRGFSAHDGDTFRATFRLANIDAPEIDGKCDYERKLAVQARDFTRAWLARGNVTIRQDGQRGTDQFGRILVHVERNGEDLGRTLIQRGLARAWDGKRRPWC